MPLNVYIDLVSPFVSVAPDPNGSIWNIYPTPSEGFPTAQTRFVFGVVDGVNYLGTKLVYGTRVMFDSNEAVLVTVGEQPYWILNENSGTIFQEKPIPPDL